MQQIDSTQLRETMQTLWNGLRRHSAQIWAAHGDTIKRWATDRRTLAVLLILALMLTLAMRDAPSDAGSTDTISTPATEVPDSTIQESPAQESTAAQKGVPEAGIVACIGVVLDKKGMQHGFLQLAGQTLDQVLTDLGKTTVVRQGYTIQHNDCYESWQGAADFMTDGEMTVPDNMTAENFMIAYFQWKANKQ